MISFLKLFERIIVFVLIVMMVVVIVIATIELGRFIISSIVSSPTYLLDISSLLDIFGIFLLILIGVELLETIRAYLVEHVVHVEVVLEVALIAIARKVIILDVKGVPPLTIIGIATLVLALAAAYYLEKAGRLRQLFISNNSFIRSSEASSDTDKNNPISSP